MPKPKRKTLPKDFEQLLQAGDLARLKAVFEECDVNARGGVSKHTALAFSDCPDALARWLVAQGIDLAATDARGHIALHDRARHYRNDVGVLLELGADVHHDGPSCGTPLHAAADSCSVHNVALLIAHGARVDARNRDGLTPLAYALLRADNARLPALVAVCAQLLAAGAQRSPQMQTAIKTIGMNFEFHCSGFNPDSVEKASAALDRLYGLFDVPPVPRRLLHDGSAPIVPSAAGWQAQHHALWQQLVPSSGAAATVQGEVIRITGRIGDELLRNGGVNWDADYRMMSQALLALFGTGVPLPATALAEAAAIVAKGKRLDDCDRMAELAVAWVRQNPTPMALPTPPYRR